LWRIEFMLAEISTTTIGVWLGVASALLVALGTLGGLAIKVGFSLAKQYKDELAALRTDHAVNAANITAITTRVDAQHDVQVQTSAAVNAVALAMPNQTQQQPPPIKLDPVALAQALHSAMTAAGKAGTTWPAPAPTLPAAHSAPLKVQT
jgi:hypothetical protein